MGLFMRIFIFFSLSSCLDLLLTSPEVESLENDSTFQSTENVSDCKECKTLAEQEQYVCIMSPSQDVKNDHLVTCTTSLPCTIISYFSKRQTERTKPLPNLMTEFDDCPPIHNPFCEYNAIDNWGLNLALVDKAFFVKRNPLTGTLPDKKVNDKSDTSEYHCELNTTTFMTELYSQSHYKKKLDFDNINMSCVSAVYCNCNLTIINTASIDIDILDKSRLVGLPNAIQLDLVYRGISEIAENAFDFVRNIQILNMSFNDFSGFPNHMLQPLQQLKVLNISNNRLNESVFETLTHSKLEVLILNSNYISEICDLCLDGFHSLQVLSLKRNLIKSLSNTFQGAPNLKILDLSTNVISHVSEISVHSLINLRELHLKGNKIQALSDQLFVKNSQLEYLDLSFNKLNSVPELSKLSNLSELRLQRNNLRSITLKDNDILCNLRNLQYLDIKNNLLFRIIPGAFNCSSQLKILDLGGNLLDDLTSLQDANAKSIFLDYNRLTHFTFGNIPEATVKMNISYNNIQKWISHTNDSNIKNYNIQTLIATKNNLTLLSDLELPPSLKFLDLSHNGIQSISIRNAFQFPQLTINLKSNNISYVCNFLVDAFQNENFPQLELDLNPIQCSCEVTRLAFLYKQLPNPTNDLSGCSDTLIASEKIRYAEKYNGFSMNGRHFNCSSTPSLKLCQCNLYSDYAVKCGLPCPATCACYLNARFNYYVINCTYKRLYSFPKMAHVKLPSYADFSHNELTVLNSSMLTSYSNIEELLLSHNRLKTIEEDAFSNQEQLTILDLSNNLLETLPSQLFVNNKILKKLYLSHNLLTNLPDTLLLSWNNLSVLNLQNNSLTNFPVWTFEKLKSLSPRGLNIIDNPWSCECNYFIKFSAWLQTAFQLLEYANELSCTLDKDGLSQIYFLSYNNSHCKDNSSPLQTDYLSLWLSIVILSIVIFVTVIFMYLYRHEMQVLIYSRYGVRIFENSQIDDSDKHFDVFIAYSSEDEEFVVYELLPGLEQINTPYRVCIHQRDFLAGAVITKSIFEAVEFSRRTLVVLSNNFTQSGWCKFEFLTAHNASLCDRARRLIVVILRDIPDDCEPEMKLYLKTNTYLQWGDKLFWKKLYYALPDRKMIQHVNNRDVT